MAYSLAKPPSGFPLRPRALSMPGRQLAIVLRHCCQLPRVHGPCATLGRGQGRYRLCRRAGRQHQDHRGAGPPSRQVEDRAVPRVGRRGQRGGRRQGTHRLSQAARHRGCGTAQDVSGPVPVARWACVSPDGRGHHAPAPPWSVGLLRRLPWSEACLVTGGGHLGPRLAQSALLAEHLQGNHAPWEVPHRVDTRIRLFGVDAGSMPIKTWLAQSRTFCALRWPPVRLSPCR